MPANPPQEVAETPSSLPANDAPLPRSERKPRHDKADRGLPPDTELADLASEYLRVQTKRCQNCSKPVCYRPVTTA